MRRQPAGSESTTSSTRARSFSIRRARLADATGILDCLRAAFEPYRANYSAEAFADTTLTPATLERRLAEATVLVATDISGEVIGTVALSTVSPQEGHIRGLAVRPDWQGRGVAGALLRRVESDLRARHCSRISLDTTEPLQRAMGFYRKHGFRPSGRVSDFFGMPLFEYIKMLSLLSKLT
jgi:predicted N-acetyltransferase YhbS